MSALGFVLAAALPALGGAAVPHLVSVKSTMLAQGPALMMVFDHAPAPLQVVASGEGVSIHAVAEVPEAVAVPGELVAPLQSISVARRSPAHLEVRLSRPAVAELRPLGATVVVLFAEGPSGGASVQDTPVPALYPLLFPQSPGEETESGGQVAGTGEQEGQEEEEGRGFSFLGLKAAPAVTVSYVRSRVKVAEASEPVDASFVEVQPELNLRVSPAAFQGSSFRITYEPKFRRLTNLSSLREPAHLVAATLNLPVLPTLTLVAEDRYSRGFLETTEVDRGREYFFDLARYRRNDLQLGLRLDQGSGHTAEIGVGRNDLDLERDDAGFFSYLEDHLRARVGHDIGATRVQLDYEYTRVPAPASRELAASSAHQARIGAQGTLGPLLTGELMAGLESRSAPAAGAGGTSFSGLVLAAKLSQEISRESRLQLTASRDTFVSNFAENAFYVSNNLQPSYFRSGPAGTTLSASLYFRWNRYLVIATGTDEPRRDNLFGWSVGAGRAIYRGIYGRLDYTRDRRRSNLPFANSSSSSLILQLGFGLTKGR